jgi:hypothetical protein
MARADYWNHNVHYQPVILSTVPTGCGPALLSFHVGRRAAGDPD